MVDFLDQYTPADDLAPDLVAKVRAIWVRVCQRDSLAYLLHSRSQQFKNMVHVYGELVRHGLLHYSVYIRTLIARGVFEVGRPQAGVCWRD